MKDFYFDLNDFDFSDFVVKDGKSLEEHKKDIDNLQNILIQMNSDFNRKKQLQIEHYTKIINKRCDVLSDLKNDGKITEQEFSEKIKEIADSLDTLAEMKDDNEKENKSRNMN